MSTQSRAPESDVTGPLRNIFDVHGRRVLITGAGRGIGRGVGRVLAAAGADVALNALTGNFVMDAAAEIGAASGRNVRPIIGDVTTSEGAVEIVARATEALGGLDVLINNLGDSIGGKIATADPNDAAMGEEDVHLALGVNLVAAIHCVRAVGSQFLRQHSGSVINISSVAALRGGDGTVVYTAAKTAIPGFTRALALEWAPHGIRVNAIAPGLVLDPQSQDAAYRARLEALAGSFPLARVGTAEEVGYLAWYLLSPASAYMTGQTIVLDGGWSLGAWSLPPANEG